MFVSSPEEARVLKLLGRELKKIRLARGERQADFAARLSISTPTYRRMESGSGGVPLAYWLRLLSVLDHLKGLETLLLQNARTQPLPSNIMRRARDAA